MAELKPVDNSRLASQAPLDKFVVLEHSNTFALLRYGQLMLMQGNALRHRSTCAQQWRLHWRIRSPCSPTPSACWRSKLSSTMRIIGCMTFHRCQSLLDKWSVLALACLIRAGSTR